MKEVRLAYGRHGMVARVPDDAVVVTATELPGLPDEAGAVRGALGAPSTGRRWPSSSPARAHRGAARGAAGPRVAVVFPDLTRPMPNRTVLPPLLAELERLGVGPRAGGAAVRHGHPPPGRARRDGRVDRPRDRGRYRVHQHRAEADEDEHVEVGRVDGTPVRLDRRYVEADVRILTGFVEPHFFAGFSGGPKGACPGLAALETILEAHSPARIADPRATWLVTEGNPVHDFVRAAVALAPPTLSLDVAINQRRQLTAVFAGPLPDGHAAACAFVEETRSSPSGTRFDVVAQHQRRAIPLDRNLYQAVKGMAAAERVRARRGDDRDGGRVRRRHAGRRRLRPAAGRGPSADALDARGRHRRRPTAGRPRCSAACSARAEVLVAHRGADRRRGPRRLPPARGAT